MPLFLCQEANSFKKFTYLFPQNFTPWHYTVHLNLCIKIHFYFFLVLFLCHLACKSHVWIKANGQITSLLIEKYQLNPTSVCSYSPTYKIHLIVKMFSNTQSTGSWENCQICSRRWMGLNRNKMHLASFYYTVCGIH